MIVYVEFSFLTKFSLKKILTMTVIRVLTTEGGADRPAFHMNTPTGLTMMCVDHTGAADPDGGDKLCMQRSLSHVNIKLINFKSSLIETVHIIFFLLI